MLLDKPEVKQTIHRTRFHVIWKPETISKAKLLTQFLLFLKIYANPTRRLGAQFSQSIQLLYSSQTYQLNIINIKALMIC